MALDARQVMGEVPGEGFEPRIAAEFGEALKRRAFERKALGLFVGDHLQAMFDPAQKHVSLAQVLLRLRADPAVGSELGQHVKRARASHLRTAPAEDELLRLHEKLDLADAAAAELDVVAGHDDAVVAAHRMDLALHRVNVCDGGVVEILAPDEGRELGEEALSEFEIARRGPGLDQRGPLPVLADGLVIGVGADRRQGDRRRGGIGPQAQVDPQNVAVACSLLQDARERLGDAHKERAGLDPCGAARWKRRRAR